MNINNSMEVLLLCMLAVSASTAVLEAQTLRGYTSGFTNGQIIGGRKTKRELESTFSRVWNYTPKTKTTDIAAIDLDLKVIADLLSNDEFDRAKRVYEEGGHSGSTAILELDVALDRDIARGTTCVVPTSGEDGHGFGWGSLYVDAKQGDKIILVQYATNHNQDDFVGCQVGALPNPKFSGCFVESGSVAFPDVNRSYEYTYKKSEENINVRSFLTLGLNIARFVENDTSNKYTEYYGSPIYADEIITAAFNGQNIGRGGKEIIFDASDNTIRKEIIATSMVLLIIWMTVVGSMEESVSKCYLDTCETGVCEESPGMFEWDSAVAYYAGSSLAEPSTSIGNLLFYYADTLCQDMATCGKTGTEKQGNSFVNHQIFDLFTQGQGYLQEGYCDGAQGAKNKIIELMAVPLVQGAIRYAHIAQGEMEEGAPFEKHDAVAAGYSLAVAPLVHHCNADDAEILFDYLNTNSSNFVMVKNALEKNYQCMNITCRQVGGVYDESTNAYKEGAEPCVDSTEDLTQESAATGSQAIFGYAVLCFSFALMAGICLSRRCRRNTAKGKEHVSSVDKGEEDAKKEIGDSKAPLGEKKEESSEVSEVGDSNVPVKENEEESSELSGSNINLDTAPAKTKEEVDEEMDVMKKGITQTSSC